MKKVTFNGRVNVTKENSYRVKSDSRSNWILGSELGRITKGEIFEEKYFRIEVRIQGEYDIIVIQPALEKYIIKYATAEDEEFPLGILSLIAEERVEVSLYCIEGDN